MAMDNKTVRDAIQVHGTNPQFLIEKILRTRIYESTYWKESCFGLTESSIIEKAYELTSIGGQYGAQKPTEFICLVLKLLQLQPREEIVIKYITGLTENDNNKYLRALGAFYLRLVGKPVDIYKTLEPFLVDGRKLRKRGNNGYSIIHMDEFIDELLREERISLSLSVKIKVEIQVGIELAVRISIKISQSLTRTAQTTRPHTFEIAV
ncbi:hypothetical protein BGZ97_004907 [Linnemannia gamsii]|uniref:Pre-mRNA-splicing factor 38 n=1 Tax=Linnemannia gamsii TaxID=64522 RepID=A0A9P6QV60_9FUNG|nr:hypothetical protein BGZ97_004907 [Linnemannia gamsii]